MVRAKRERRGGVPDQHHTRGTNEPWRISEDDPLRDLRPEDEDDPRNPEADEYIWPDLTEENEDD